jgi:hypothetical protein
MKTMKILFASTMVFAGLVLTGCKKSGCTDEAALNYNEEAKEDDGTCVFSDAKSQIITISNWTGSGTGYYASATVPIITSSISSTGAVLCFIEDATTSGAYWAMPYSEVFFDASGVEMWTRHWGFANDSDEILIQTQDSDGFTVNPGTRKFKIVVIESSGLQTHPDVDLTNYKEVKEAFNL